MLFCKKNNLDVKSAFSGEELYDSRKKNGWENG